LVDYIEKEKENRDIQFANGKQKSEPEKKEKK
jgi:hypothetical protein